jgi:hypothetical protein
VPEWAVKRAEVVVMASRKGLALVTGPGSLLARADRLLMVAAGEHDPAERFLGAYLAALRGAAAVLAAVEHTRPVRPRSRSAWVLMSRAAPEFVMWADYFAGYSAIRAALGAGITQPVTEQQADDFYSRVGAFLHDVEDLLGDAARLCPREGWGTGLTA